MIAKRHYQAPDSLAGLVAALASAQDPILIAGGQSLLPALAERGIRSGWMVDIGRIAALKTITFDADGVTIGAGTVMADLVRGPIAALCPALAEAAGAVGNHVVRGRSTVGGCLGWANPRAEIPMILIAHDATIMTQHRAFRADALMTGAFATVLAPGEAILSVRIQTPPRMVFEELISRNSTGRAIVSVACADMGKRGTRVTLAGLTDRPVSGLMLATGTVATPDLIRAAIADRAELSHTTSPDYRIAAACALVRRCRERLGA